jgi:hypothetical protein
MPFLATLLKKKIDIVFDLRTIRGGDDRWSSPPESAPSDVLQNLHRHFEIHPSSLRSEDAASDVKPLDISIAASEFHSIRKTCGRECLANLAVCSRLDLAPMTATIGRLQGLPYRKRRVCYG